MLIATVMLSNLLFYLPSGIFQAQLLFGGSSHSSTLRCEVEALLLTFSGLLHYHLHALIAVTNYQLILKAKELKSKHPPVLLAAAVVVCECGMIYGLSGPATRVISGNICVPYLQLVPAVIICVSIIFCTLLAVWSYVAVFKKAKVILRKHHSVLGDDTLPFLDKRMLARQVLNVALLIFTWGGVFLWALLTILNQPINSEEVAAILQITVFLHGLGDLVVHALSNPGVRAEYYKLLGMKSTDTSMLAVIIEKIINLRMQLSQRMLANLSRESLGHASSSSISLDKERSLEDGEQFHYINMGLAEFERMESEKDRQQYRTKNAQGFDRRVRITTLFGVDCWGCCGFVDIDYDASSQSFSCLSVSCTAENLGYFNTACRLKASGKHGSILSNSNTAFSEPSREAQNKLGPVSPGGKVEPNEKQILLERDLGLSELGLVVQ